VLLPTAKLLEGSTKALHSETRRRSNSGIRIIVVVVVIVMVE
jgi:hypothetical protein